MLPQDETIPQSEALVLRLAIATARECAGEGRLADGYTCLLQGLGQARRAFARGECWGAELVVGYLQAADDYIARYGVRIETKTQA
jgi:hypothetical protein